MNEDGMDRADIRHLIGGYATGSLTADERRRLFEAALEDQELFDALQDEQALKELLDDPVSREQVRRAAAASLPPARPRRAWLWALAASMGAAALLTLLFFNSNRITPSTVRVARMRPAAPPSAQPAPLPAVPAPLSIPRKQTLPSRTLPSPSATAEPSNTPAAAPLLPRFAPHRATGGSLTAPSPSATKEPSNPPAAVTEQAPRPTVYGGALTVPGAAGFQAQRKEPVSALSSAAPLASAPSSIIVRFRKKIPNGTDMNVPPAALQPGDVVRLTLFPRLPGPLAIAESDAADPAWKTVFPAAGPPVQLQALQDYAVPLEITVNPGERLRVKVGAATAEIKLGR